MIRFEDRHMIGRVVATEAMPAGPHQFQFWTATDTTLGIGAIVMVDDERGKTVYADRKSVV